LEAALGQVTEVIIHVAVVAPPPAAHARAYVLCLNLSSKKYRKTPKKALTTPARIPRGQLKV
jgi:hypothetical protein